MTSPNEEFENWLANPPEEYRALFAEINQVSAEFDQRSAEVRQGITELKQAADSLDQAAQDCRVEADRLNGDRQARSQRIRLLMTCAFCNRHSVQAVPENILYQRGATYCSGWQIQHEAVDLSKSFSLSPSLLFCSWAHMDAYNAEMDTNEPQLQRDL